MMDDFGPYDSSAHWPSEPTRPEDPAESELLGSSRSRPAQPDGTHADRGSCELGLADLQEDGPGQITRETAHSERPPADVPNVEHGSPLSQPIADLGPNTLCISRPRRPPSHLDDYVCYNTRSQDPLSLAHRLQKESSGTPYPIANYVTSTNFSASHQNFLATITKITEPRSYHEAVKDPRWRTTMEEEIRALEKNQTWILQELPPGNKSISCQWV